MDAEAVGGRPVTAGVRGVGEEPADGGALGAQSEPGRTGGAAGTAGRIREGGEMNQALGWTLLHFVWQGAAVALLLAAVLPAVRTARVRYGAACFAMLAMAAAFAV